MTFIVNSCKKNLVDLNKETEEAVAGAAAPGGNCITGPTICEDCVTQSSNDDDSTGVETILGTQFNNPYSMQIMQQAYLNIFHQTITLQPSHKYIKITCTDLNKLYELDEMDIELSDYPLSYNVIQEGDYYPNATIVGNSGEIPIPALYAVITTNTVMPAGINFEVLENLYIPDRNEALEDEAYYLTNNLDCPVTYTTTTRPQRINDYKLILWEPCRDFNLDCSGLGGGGGGGITTTNSKPSGNINFKTYSSSSILANGINASEPLKNIKVLGRRFFKRDYAYTDNQGNFQFTKTFPRKVSLIVKFKTSSNDGNQQIRQNKITDLGISVWKEFFPMKKNIGVYKGKDLSSLNYNFEKGNNWYGNQTRKWVAAVTINTVSNYNKFIISKGMHDLPTKLILALNRREQDFGNNSAAIYRQSFDFLKRSDAPLGHQIQGNTGTIVSNSFLFGGYSTVMALTYAYLAPAAAFAIPVFAVFTIAGTALLLNNATAPLPDIVICADIDDVSKLTASSISLNVAQQLGVACLYKYSNSNTVGNTNNFTLYNNHIEDIRRRINRDYTEPQYKFGNKSSTTSVGYGGVNPQLCAVWQAYIQHMSHSVIDYMYGTGEKEFKLQNKIWTSSGSNSSSQYLEDFNPNVSIADDNFKWIPVGLINDLMDTNVDPASIVNDNVSGFTFLDVQAVYGQNPTTMLDVKNRFKAIKPAQSIQIDQLFASYGY